MYRSGRTRSRFVISGQSGQDEPDAIVVDGLRLAVSSGDVRFMLKEDAPDGRYASDRGWAREAHWQRPAYARGDADSLEIGLGSDLLRHLSESQETAFRFGLSFDGKTFVTAQQLDLLDRPIAGPRQHFRSVAVAALAVLLLSLAGVFFLTSSDRDPASPVVQANETPDQEAQEESSETPPPREATKAEPARSEPLPPSDEVETGKGESPIAADPDVQPFEAPVSSTDIGGDTGQNNEAGGVGNVAAQNPDGSSHETEVTQAASEAPEPSAVEVPDDEGTGEGSKEDNCRERANAIIVSVPPNQADGGVSEKLSAASDLETSGCADGTFLVYMHFASSGHGPEAFLAVARYYNPALPVRVQTTVEPNAAEACRWYKKAIQQNDQTALEELARLREWLKNKGSENGGNAEDTPAACWD